MTAILHDEHVRRIERVYHEEYGRCLAALISQFKDFELAEDALQDALIAAMETWEREGVPRSPGAWLTAIAKRRIIDRLRRRVTVQSRDPLILDTLPQEATGFDPEDEAMFENGVPDERLKLMFTCCHPSLGLEAQVALTLRTLGGLSTQQIAHAFLVPLPTMAQRLTRAQNKIRDAGIPFAIPPAHRLPERLDALLAVLYLIFNEGYVASSGHGLTREALCDEAIRLARSLVDLLAAVQADHSLHAEAQGLLALMLLHHARRAARVSDSGTLVLLEDQNRALWDQTAIAEGIAILTNALKQKHIGIYQLQAAISAVHAEAPTYADTDWPQIVQLYGLLVRLRPTPVIEVNRAVAVAMVEGPAVGLRLLHQIGSELDEYYPYHAARADLLRRMGEREAAADAYQQAFNCCPNALERAFLARRRDDMLGSGPE
ncbi:MAG: RNA polymerase sigma factor [Anaerolineae bacterium]